MTENQKQAIRQRLKRAHETLSEARILEEAHHFVGAVNRLYYGCFYAVSALLETKALKSSKHSGVIALFNQHFVKTGVVRKELGELFRYMFDSRQGGDYTDFPDFTAEEVAQLRQSATNLVDEIARFLEKESQ